jgi:nucleoside-diphosphate-sugar epimerase
VPPSTVLVTRASRFIGGQLAARLAADHRVGRESL